MSDEAWASYFIKGTKTLINRLGLHDGRALRQFENEVTTLRTTALLQKPLPHGYSVKPPYSVEHLQEIHQYIFKDVYHWAGEMRLVDISKGKTAFAPLRSPGGLDLIEQGKIILSGIERDNYLRDLGKEAFVTKLAEHYHAVNMWHPFREGNGRASRVFFGQLAHEAGYFLDYTLTNAGAWRLAFAEAGERNDYFRMHGVLRDIARPHRALGFDHALKTHEYGRVLREFSDLHGAIATYQNARAELQRREPTLPEHEQNRQMKPLVTKLQQELHEGRIPAIQTPQKALTLLKDLNRTRSL